MIDEKQPDDAFQSDEDTSSTYVTFELGEQVLGVEVRHVREILNMQKITRLPNAPMDVEGVVDVRGISVPIVDLKSRLGVPGIDIGKDARIVIIEIAAGTGEGAERKPLGIVADRVRNVDQITDAEIEPVPTLGAGGIEQGVIKGLSRRGADLIVLVDLQRVFGGDGIDLGTFP